MGSGESTPEPPSGEEDTGNCFLSPSFDFKHKHRVMPYRSEQLEVEGEEARKVADLVEKSVGRCRGGESADDTEPCGADMRWRRVFESRGRSKIIIDTDIGTDADDVLALLTALNMEEAVEILGVTTNYYPTQLRKRVAEEILHKAGEPYSSIPVVAGSSFVCGTHRSTFLQGHEGNGIALSAEEVERVWKANDDDHAVEFLYHVLQQHPKEVTIVAIGMATNIGMLAHAHPDVGELIKHIVVMSGGSFLCSPRWKAWDHITGEEHPPWVLPPNDETAAAWLRAGMEVNGAPSSSEVHPVTLLPNHNSSGDSLGSFLLFNTLRCPISIVPHGVTAMHWLGSPGPTVAIRTLRKLGRRRHRRESSRRGGAQTREEEEASLLAATRVCGVLLEEWLKTRWGQNGQCPHDPLALYEAVYPSCGAGRAQFTPGESCLQYSRGTLVCHEWAGFLTFVPDIHGPHRIATAPLDADAWVQWLDETLVRSVPEDQRVKSEQHNTSQDERE